MTERTIALCRRYVDEVRLVEERDIERAVMAYLAQVKVLAEGAGAAGLAAVMADPDHFVADGSGWCCAAATSIRASSLR